MRVAYIFAVIIAATLHASGAALPATKGSKVMIDNVATPAIADATQTNAGRQLRRVHKNSKKEDEIEEERLGASRFGKFIQSKAAQFAKSSPGKWLEKQKELRRISREKKLDARNARNIENIIASGGIPKYAGR
ncbi:Avirulence (Avh) protein [Phytophthora megakarya]|uniref:RxLR effector protein n=1 Tax=Phytophthora megakarya TaxID=4795 RepID=A0A225WIG5_9STRA|nr:Avirulence (Avh) protein [Phytophthora megakarya]